MHCRNHNHGRRFRGIVGEILDEYDTEEFIEKQIAENEFIFSGRLELDYLENKYGLIFQKKKRKHYQDTLSTTTKPFHAKERIIIDDYEFDIISVSDTRIEM